MNGVFAAFFAHLSTRDVNAFPPAHLCETLARTYARSASCIRTWPWCRRTGCTCPCCMVPPDEQRPARRARRSAHRPSRLLLADRGDPAARGRAPIAPVRRCLGDHDLPALTWEINNVHLLSQTRGHRTITWTGARSIPLGQRATRDTASDRASGVTGDTAGDTAGDGGGDRVGEGSAR